MDGLPPSNPGPDGPSQEADPLALARRLIDMARAEELEHVELGPLPVLPAPGAELSPLELAMQLLHSAREEEDTTRPPEENPLDLAMRLIDSVRQDEGSPGEDRLAVASQLLEVEERERGMAARRGTESLASPEPEIQALPVLTPLLGAQRPYLTADGLLSLPLIGPAADSPEVPTRPLVEATPDVPALSLIEDAAAALTMPQIPALLNEGVTRPEMADLPRVETAISLPEIPALPLVEATDRLPETEAPPVIKVASTQPEIPALPTVETLPEPPTAVVEPSPIPEVRPMRLSEMPALPLEPARAHNPDPAEMARQLLESGEKSDPAFLARKLLDEAAREEESDPFALARRLLKDALREEKPEASPLMGAPAEEGAPPPRFDPAGLGVPSEALLGAPEPAPFNETQGWQGSTCPPETAAGWPPPAAIEQLPNQPPWAPPAPEPTIQPPWATQEPPAPEAPIRPPWATQEPPAPEAPIQPPWATRDEPESAPRLALERAVSEPNQTATNNPAETDSKALRLERREMPMSRTMRMDVPKIGPNVREEASRLALERAPKPKVESTRDGESDPVRARPETSIPTVPVVPQTYRPVAAAPAPSSPRRAATLAPKRPDGFGTDLRKRLRRLVDRSARVEPEDVVIFTRQFSAMVSAGLQLHQALHFYAESHTESGLGEVISEIAGKVSQGSTLSAAMRQHPTVFPEVYTGLIAAGETTGMLVAILSKLAELCERNQKLRQRVLAAITYPAVVMVVSLICIAVFIWVVLPMFVPMFNQLGVQLPWPTRTLLWLSDAGRNPILLTSLGLSIPMLWLSWPWWRRFFGSPRRRRAIDRALLGLPYFGPLIERIITARLLFSMASLLDAGIPFTNCLEKCEHVAGNAEIAHRLKMARGLLIEGDTAADCLAAHRVFPSGAIQMIAVGEESAQLSEMIRRVATVYEEDVQMALMDLASMLEPLILLVMGVVVGFIVLASALPTAQLLQSL